MLVAVSLYSLVTTIPRLIAVGMNDINSIGLSFDVYWFYMWAARIIAPWNYCGNFFMYVLSGKEFREELALMFCLRERPSGTCVVSSHNTTFQACTSDVQRTGTPIMITFIHHTQTKQAVA